MARQSPDISHNNARTPHNIGSPIDIRKYSLESTDKDRPLIEKFSNCTSAEEQLEILLDIIKRDSYNRKIVNFLVVVFYETPAKHPVKSFLTKHVTKSDMLQKLFTELLGTLIRSHVKPPYYRYEEYADVVPRILTCIDNFPAGAAAIKSINVDITKYLLGYFNNARYQVLSDIERKISNQTAKTDIYNLDHSIMRILVHIIQRLEYEDVRDRPVNWSWMLNSIKIYNCVENLICCEDVPMDTKCLCGMLVIHFERLTGSLQCMKWLTEYEDENHHYARLLKPKAGQLALSAAIASLIPIQELQRPVHYNETTTPMLVVLIRKLLSIPDSNGSEQALTLGVARALLHLSKSLDQVGMAGLGAQAVELVLQFVWRHLQYHLDSVRHLTHQILAALIAFCAHIEQDYVDDVLNIPGEPEPLARLLESLVSLGSCKGFFWGVGSAAPVLGARRVLRDLCAPPRLLRAITHPHLQAAAMGALDTLIKEHAKEARSSEIFEQWVLPTLARVEQGCDSACLTVMERVLRKAVRSHDRVRIHIESHIRANGRGSARCALLVARAMPDLSMFRDLVKPHHLREAMLHPSQETRILALSLVAQSRKSTQTLSADELTFVLNFLRYNINEHSHNFRQLMLANMKKLLKRLEDSWRVMERSGETGAHYVTFWNQLRELCYSCLLPGANYGRRVAALELLACALTQHWIWKEDHIETLLLHLDDSYEVNKELALKILQHCPVELLKSKTYSTSLDLNEILKQASSLKPSESVSAAYKLQLLLDKLPERILEGNDTYNRDYKGEDSLRAVYTLIGVVTSRAAAQRPVSEDMIQSVRKGGMFGTLHCLAALGRREDVRAVLWSPPWNSLSVHVTETCLKVLADVVSVVGAASPEGYLPPHWASDDEGQNASPVTAQMVLVCAWRTVKEASDILGSVAAALPACEGPDPIWQATEICEQLVSLLERAQHRGAVEQAARGLATTAQRFWRDPVMAGLAERWLQKVLEVAASDAGATHHATRRGAGLPFIVQSLVTTELNTPGRGERFNEVMRTLLRLADPTAPAAPTTPTAATAPAGTAVAERRTLCANILRALFRASGVESAVVPYVGEGLRIAVLGFAADVWPERTAMSLLFGALSVRAFGVERSRGGNMRDRRNMRSGRAFFQLYPQLYDVLLNIVTEASEEESAAVRPALLPALLLLARLYPSALEGTDTNLKLSAFVSPVVRCARSGVLHARVLVASALRALLPPQQYVSHLEWIFGVLSDVKVQRNYCHGLLLQASSLLQVPPRAQTRGPSGFASTVWILEQCVGPRPCYVIADEYAKVVNLLLWRFPECAENGTIVSIQAHLKELLSSDFIPPITTGRDVCLANCLHLYLILLHKAEELDLIVQATQHSIQHKSCDVVMATLDYYLMLHAKYDGETQLEKRLRSVCDSQVLGKLRQNPTYVKTLANYLHGSKYLECHLKCLRLLTLENGTQKDILNETNASDTRVFDRLIDCVQYGSERSAHMFLESLLSYVEEKLNVTSSEEHAGDFGLDNHHRLAAMRAVFQCSSAENSEDTRGVVLSYLENKMETIMTTDLDNLVGDGNQFEYKATALATLVTLLEDEDDAIRQRAADVAARIARLAVDLTLGYVTLGDVTLVDATPEDVSMDPVPQVQERLLPSASAEMLREYVYTLEHNSAYFLVLALLDFNAEVCMTDDIGDECRVFDQGERYNIYLEETVWTSACADKIIKLHAQHDVDLIDFVLSLINDRMYSCTFQKLCKDNVSLFQKMAKEAVIKKDDTINPKIELFIRKLRSKC